MALMSTSQALNYYPGRIQRNYLHNSRALGRVGSRSAKGSIVSSTWTSKLIDGGGRRGNLSKSEFLEGI